MHTRLAVSLALLCSRAALALPAAHIADLFTGETSSSWHLQTSSIKDANPRLDQHQTNGDSTLGSLDAPTYPKYLPAAGISRSSLSASKAKLAQTSNTTQQASSSQQIPNNGLQVPNTGVTRSYDFTISQGTLAPDGVEKSVMLINGQFPGPTVEANYGDTIQVTVHNNLTEVNEGTSLHWHGMLQTNTNYEDGVPGVTQCPIAPGQTFTYSFLADMYGTSWYHSHYSAQYVAGLFGALVVHAPNETAEYDVDLGPVILSDYYYTDYYDLVEDVMGTNKAKVSPLSDNNLINGKGIMNCSLVQSASCTPDAGLAKFQFQQGKTHRLRLINAGGDAVQKFSIDNHKLTVIANDWIPLVPYEVDVVTLGVGQRTDVLVTANGDATDAVWMRSTISSCSRTKQPNALAIVYYPEADETAVPTTSALPDTTDPCANDDLSLAVPYFSMTPPSQPDLTIEVDLNITQNATGHFLWTMNDSSFRTDFNNPILPLLQAGQDPSTFPTEWNVYNTGEASSVRVIVNNLTPITHPMHLHGQNMYVLASGGSSPQSTTQIQWDGTIVNPQNPTRRDVQLLPPNGYLVMQFDSFNPGVWPFHCHIAWHVSGGLYVNLLTHPAEIPSSVKSPASVNGLCSNWNAFTSTDVPDQIDSGL